MIRPPRRPPLFPYTPLSRSGGAPVGTAAGPAHRAAPTGGLPRLGGLGAARGGPPVPSSTGRGPAADPRAGAGTLQRPEQAAPAVSADPLRVAAGRRRGRVRGEGADGGRVRRRVRGPLDAQLPGLPAGDRVAADHGADPGTAPVGPRGDRGTAGGGAGRAGAGRRVDRGGRGAAGEPGARPRPAPPDDRVALTP